MIFDPSGTTNYCNGLADALCEEVDLTVVVRDNFKAEKEEKYLVKRWFKLSEKGKNDKLLKGLKYIVGYLKTLNLVYKQKFDIVHIQWLLKYPIDIFFLKKIKKKCPCIIYTAHNVLPHIAGGNYKKYLKEIYTLVDKIIVHGNGAKQELIDTFPELDLKKKIFIQYHGANICNSHKSHCKENQEILCKLRKYTGKHILYLGVIFDNKGVDRLFDFWVKYSMKFPEDILIVAGKISERTNEYDILERKFNSITNSIYLPEKISEELHDFLYEDADIVVLPYRHASMSGVVFDAARFSKAIFTTNVGCIPEYLENGIDSIIVENNEDDIERKLRVVLQSIGKEQLKCMGENLHNNIYKKYNWDIITKNLIDDCYRMEDK